jgi:alkylhydroperoxidase/carboxymuconolactone decarboxylase family protein YurZ
MLGEKDHRLIRLFTAIVLGRWDELERVRAAAPSGEPDRAWREAVLQSHLFGGMPRTVEAYEVLDRVGGLGVPDEAEIMDELDRPDRGVRFFELIYRQSATSVRARLESFHPDFSRWIVGHAYGRVLTRPGLEPDMRELLAVAALSALGPDRQLASHARGAVRAGAKPEEVFSVLPVIADLIAPERCERARGVLERFVKNADAF